MINCGVKQLKLINLKLLMPEFKRILSRIVFLAQRRSDHGVQAGGLQNHQCLAARYGRSSRRKGKDVDDCLGEVE